MLEHRPSEHTAKARSYPLYAALYVLLASGHQRRGRGRSDVLGYNAVLPQSNSKLLLGSFRWDALSRR